MYLISRSFFFFFFDWTAHSDSNKATQQQWPSLSMHSYWLKKKTGGDNWWSGKVVLSEAESQESVAKSLNITPSKFWPDLTSRQLEFYHQPHSMNCVCSMKVFLHVIMSAFPLVGPKSACSNRWNLLTFRLECVFLSLFVCFFLFFCSWLMNGK